ncbi:MAG: cadherin-like beta sandwich domain-containing protein [Coriobacteriia bacterium]|nr:cadherin-like beta sandwich domain-containing protein [Coriobacteriia bacterium]
MMAKSKPMHISVGLKQKPWQYVAIIFFVTALVLSGILGVPLAYGNDNPFLRELRIEGAEFDGPFRYAVTYYSVQVPEEMDRLNITAVPQESSSTVEIIGNEDLQPGVNHVTVRVIATNGTTLDYHIEVTRDGTLNSETAELGSLFVVGHVLYPLFRPDLVEYSLDVPFGVTELEVDAVAMGVGATVNITGANNLAVGMNQIIITVTSADGNLEQEYRIEVTRLDEVADDSATDNNAHDVTLHEDDMVPIEQPDEFGVLVLGEDAVEASTLNPWPLRIALIVVGIAVIATVVAIPYLKARHKRTEIMLEELKDADENEKRKTNTA